MTLNLVFFRVRVKGCDLEKLLRGAAARRLGSVGNGKPSGKGTEGGSSNALKLLKGP